MWYTTKIILIFYKCFNIILNKRTEFYVLFEFVSYEIIYELFDPKHISCYVSIRKTLLLRIDMDKNSAQSVKNINLTIIFLYHS